ncbi:Translation factor pelota [Tieghemiomyces parasiticus]|uniref:Protein DOM34 homolog n=1 Tax=Tieghemiomyces parasiticus TaxID=78921 RepID=A0A9W8DRB9_9FUNG|nr:Translation factor pelota [Tieghemiomyces parasiticus]
MKLIAKHIEKDRTGYVTLCPEEAEDMWYIYNILQVGDRLKASTVRRVTTESSTGSVASSRVRTKVTIVIAAIDFDSQASTLHVNGQNVEENKHIKLGAFHTLDLELRQNFTLAKAEWDFFTLGKIDEACDLSKRAEVGAIVLQEGLANVCLLTQNMTVVRQRIETPVPRKRQGSATDYEKGMVRFYDQVFKAMLLHIDLTLIKAVIIASPGFTKKSGLKLIFENKYKFLLVHCSSGHKHALQEVIQDPTVRARLADTKASRETRALEDFYKMLNDDEDRAFYGYDHVARANEQGAIDRLLVTDALFRSADIATRKRYIALAEAVRADGGKVHIFSSHHVSGEQLSQLTGVAAMLKFPIPDLESDSNDGDENDEG